eukprot:TRINITY_DN2973_c0_g1_i1.p1 TRINITY_DN2973_c0_g1~~TRINITY_DN2973_c0_g1_i1.p1  ORF type:complete len:154 (-),score=25.35 TRINITY_DN2973_c0_g1_i1:82-495(-)
MSDESKLKNTKQYIEDNHIFTLFQTLSKSVLFKVSQGHFSPDLDLKTLFLQEINERLAQRKTGYFKPLLDEQELRVYFQECDLTKSGHLSKSVAETAVRDLQIGKFMEIPEKGCTENEFVKICVDGFQEMYSQIFSL